MRQLRRAQHCERWARCEAPALQKPDEAAHDRQTARDRAALDPRRAMREIGTEIRGEQMAEAGEARRLAEMQGQEIEKEGEVAAIGGDRVGRGAALAAEPSRPQPDCGAQIIGRGKPRQQHWHGERGEGSTSLSAPGGGEGWGEAGDSRAVADTHLTLPRLRRGSLPLPPEGRRGGFRAAISTYSYALRLARRELRGGIGGFRVFLACLVLGVGAIAATG